MVSRALVVVAETEMMTMGMTTNTTGAGKKKVDVLERKYSPPARTESPFDVELTHASPSTGNDD
jgi:hypothetical protein